MKFEDFHQQFETVFVCRILTEWNPPAVATGDWEGGPREYAQLLACLSLTTAVSHPMCVCRYAGGLITGATGHHNPSYRVHIKRATTLFFTVSQSGQTRSDFHNIMAVLYPGSKPKGAPLSSTDTSTGSFYHTGAPSQQREVREPWSCSWLGGAGPYPVVARFLASI